MTPDDVLKEIGGLPFVHETFQARKLLAMAASLRRNIDSGRHPVAHYVDPAVAYALYLAHVPNAPQPPEYEPLSEQQLAQLTAARNHIAQLIPSWQDLFTIPVAQYKLANGQVSSTNPLIPQHLYLGDRAFGDSTLLEETLVHEMSHIWCSLLAELYDFQTMDSPHDYTLPSGTGGKSVRGVLLAGLFAAAAIQYYLRRIGEGGADAQYQRLRYLIHYLEGTLDTLEPIAFLSKMGRLVVEELRAFSRQLPAATAMLASTEA